MAMISKYVYQGVTWIDLERPTKEEAETLLHDFALPNVVCDELLSETVRSKVDLYDQIIYTILHFPTGLGKPNKIKTDQEVDIVLGKDFIITAHYEPVNALHELSKRLEVQAVLSKKSLKFHAGILFYQIIKELYKHVEIDLENLNDMLVSIENKIFHNEEGGMVKKISNINRHLIDYKQALRFHREILESFEKATLHFFGETYTYYTTAILGEYNKIDRLLAGHKEILNDLRDTNDSLLSVKTGHTMKTLTLMSFVIFPLTLIAGIFGMNVVHMPIIGQPNDFWMIIGIMGCATTLMFLFFRIKKWI